MKYFRSNISSSIHNIKASQSVSLILFAALILALHLNTSAQSRLIIRDKETNLWYEAESMAQDSFFHSAIYPRIENSISQYNSLKREHFKPFTNENWGKIQFKEHNYLSVTPIFQTELRANTTANTPQQHLFKYGLKTDLKLGKKWHFSIWGYLPGNNFKELTNKELESKALQNNQVWLPYNKILKTNEQVGAYLSYQAFSFLNIQVGKDKNFWGDGYRSLLLSDDGASYPFAKLSVNAGRFNYVILYQFLEDFNSDAPLAAFENKYAASHFISWNIGKRLNLNLFETVVWQGITSSGKQRGFDFNYAHPIIFFRPVEFSIGSPDNVLMGAGFRYRLFKNTHFYGQLILDEFKLSEMTSGNNWWANKYGVLLGVKSYHFMNVENLFVLAEYNTVRPYTYSHWSSLENYGHLKQPLAHPFGANFKEVNFVANYQLKKWQFNLKLSCNIKGLDRDTLNEGGNIYRSYNDNRSRDYGNLTTQGIKENVLQSEFKVSYIINPYWHLRVEAGYATGQIIYTDQKKYIDFFFLGINTRF